MAAARIVEQASGQPIETLLARETQSARTIQIFAHALLQAHHAAEFPDVESVRTFLDAVLNDPVAIAQFQSGLSSGWTH